MIKRFLAKRREKKRQQILALIGRDIEVIARDAYNDGCYVTRRQMMAEKQIEFARLMAENEKLRELMIERVSVAMPDITIPVLKRQGANDE